MAVLEEARAWLEMMKEHTDCCGTPIVRKLVAALEKERRHCLHLGRTHNAGGWHCQECGQRGPVSTHPTV